MTLKQRPPKTSCRLWRKRAKKPDGGAWGTRADTGATQTENRRRTTENRRDQPEKCGAWPTCTPNSKEPTGAWAPSAGRRQPTGLDLGAEGDGERGWGARVSQKWARKSRSGFQNLPKKKSERTGQKTSRRRHECWANPSRKTTWDEKSCQTKENKQITTNKSHHSPERLGEDQPPSDLTGRNKSSTTLKVRRKTNHTDPT